MKVLAISWVVSDRAHGGEGIGSYELLRHLSMLDVEVDLVTPLYDVGRPLPANVRVFPVKGGPRKGNTGANKAAMLRMVRRLERTSPPDVTQIVSQFTPWPIRKRPFVTSGCYVFPTEGAHDPKAATKMRRLARDLRRGPLVDVLRDLLFAARHQWFGGWTFRRTSRDADLVIVRQRLGLPEYQPRTRRVEYVPFGVDLERFPFSDAPREPVAFFAGSLVRYKNVDGLLEAFALASPARPEVRLRIAGAGPEQAALRAQAARLGIQGRVEFLGHLTRDALAEEYRRASVFVLPSRGESFGQVSLEALASGTPVIASSQIPGAHDYIEPGVNGWLVDPADTAAIAAAISEAFADPSRLRRMGRAGRPIAERFSWKEIARRHVELYRELIASTAASSRP